MTIAAPSDDLDAAVRRADPDRWLSTRFIADPAARADVITLYAFNDELARVAGAVTNPLMGEIRLAWWREAVEELAEGRPGRGHPAVGALGRALAGRRLDGAPLLAMIEARHRDLDPSPFAGEAEVFAYLDAGAGALMAAAAAVLGAPGGEVAVRAAGRAWGVAGLARSHWAGLPNRLPPEWTGETVRAMVDQALAEARIAARDLPVTAFPAILYAALAAPYAGRRTPGELERRARMVWATLRGRL